jgi:hypothetical protein
VTLEAARQPQEQARLAQEHEEAQEAVVADAAANQAVSPAQTQDKWMAHLKTAKCGQICKLALSVMSFARPRS